MHPLFVRFVLPPLIFGSAQYALFWNVLNSEDASSISPAASVVPPSAISRATDYSNLIQHSEFKQAGRQVAADPSPATPHLRIIPSNAVRPIAAPSRTPDVLSGLQDADPSVRIHALRESEAQGITIPTYLLQQIATVDRDANVRMLALIKYAQDGSIDPAMVRSAAEAGLRDGDPTVSTHAREILEQLNQATRSNDEMPEVLAEYARVE